MDLNGLKYDKKLLDLVTGALAGISSFMSENYVEMICVEGRSQGHCFQSELGIKSKYLDPIGETIF
uniref:ROK family protein n=1 Tax=Ascaris lumbricoides TaxID=6252 RepID=A0A0M3HID9_ASCLU